MSRRVVRFHLERFLAEHGFNPEPVQLKLIEDLLNCDPVLRMYRCNKAAQVFTLVEQFVRERGGDVVHENIIEAGKGWS